jgi:hypothetical protein
MDHQLFTCFGQDDDTCIEQAFSLIFSPYAGPEAVMFSESQPALQCFYKSEMMKQSLE